MANNKDFKVKNGLKANSYQEGLGTVISGNTSYDIANASYDNITGNISGQNSSPMGLYFKSDGLQLFVVGAGGDEVNQYSLSTAWDLSTISFVRVLALSETIPSGIFLKDDGTKMYIAGYGGDNVYEHTLSTAYDISTGTITHTLDVSSIDTIPFGLFFKPDGTKMYFSGDQNDKLVEYNLSTAWDLSTATFNQYSPAIVASARQPFFTSDGLKVFITNNSTDVLTEYSLSTAWDASTLSFVREFDLSGQETNPYGSWFKPDGTKFYTTGSTTDNIHQYSTSITSKTLDLSTGAVFELTPTSDLQIGLSNPAASGTVSQATLLLTGAEDVNGFDISSGSYDSKSLDVQSQDANSQDVAIGDSDTKIYIAGNTNNTIYQYNLTTASDLSTGSYASKSFSVGSQEGFPAGLAFKSDGTKMYVNGRTAAVYQYSLSTAWDVSTSSYDSVSFSTSSQSLEPRGLEFSYDGTKMYVADNSSGGDSIYQYNLSTAWDLSTASYSNNSLNVSSQATSPSGVRINTDGTKIFLSNGNDVYQYNLTTAFDISTASYANITLAFSEISTGTGIAFNSNGTKLYHVASTSASGNDAIFQYTTGSVTGYTTVYDSSIKFAGGTYGYFITPATAPTSPAVGKTDVMTFSTRDGGTSYQATVAIDGA